MEEMFLTFVAETEKRCSNFVAIAFIAFFTSGTKFRNFYNPKEKKAGPINCPCYHLSQIEKMFLFVKDSILHFKNNFPGLYNISKSLHRTPT
jgi:hypothetical protein